jgi:hypothetical protein
MMLKLDELVQEVESISKRAFGMALSVHEDQTLSAQLSEEARLLEKRLLNIAKELEQIDRVTHKRWFNVISESILDLGFVEGERDIVSLRLGDIIRWEK